MYLICVYDNKLYWFYGNNVCIFIILFFLSFFSILFYSAPVFYGKSTCSLSEEHQNCPSSTCTLVHNTLINLRLFVAPVRDAGVVCPAATGDVGKYSDVLTKSDRMMRSVGSDITHKVIITVSLILVLSLAGYIS